MAENKSVKSIEIIAYVIAFLGFIVIIPSLCKIADYYLFKKGLVLFSSIFFMIPGILITGFGALLCIASIAAFKTHGGAPVPGFEPEVLVVTGPYGLIRNPLALSGIMILLGEWLIYSSLSLFIISILYIVLVNFIVRFNEEPLLKEKFGKEYDDYRALVPSFFPFPGRRIK